MTGQKEIVERIKLGDYVQTKSQLFPREHGLELGQIVEENTGGIMVVENCLTGRRHYIRRGRLVKVENG